MAYDPSTLKPGDTIFVPPGSGWDPFGWGIAWATNNWWATHTGLVGHGHIVESQGVVVNSPLQKYAVHGWVLKPDASESEIEVAVSWYESKIGQAYGIDDLLKDAERDVLHIPVIAKINPHAFVCSGGVALAFEKAGKRATYAILPSPADLTYSPFWLGPRPWDQVSAPSTKAG